MDSLRWLPWNIFLPVCGLSTLWPVIVKGYETWYNDRRSGGTAEPWTWPAGLRCVRSKSEFGCCWYVEWEWIVSGLDDE